MKLFSITKQVLSTFKAPFILPVNAPCDATFIATQLEREFIPITVSPKFASHWQEVLTGRKSQKPGFVLGLGEVFSSAEDWHAFRQMQVWHPSNSSVFLYQLLLCNIFLFQMVTQDIHHVLFWQGEVDEPSTQMRCPPTRLDMVTRCIGQEF